MLVIVMLLTDMKKGADVWTLSAEIFWICGNLMTSMLNLRLNVQRLCFFLHIIIQNKPIIVFSLAQAEQFVYLKGPDHQKGNQSFKSYSR